MDPIIITVIMIFLIVLALRVFFGVAKLFLRLAALIVIAIIIWRVFLLKG